MPEINNTPMTGSQWATHHVIVWLENDAEFAGSARRIAALLESKDLRNFVHGKLYGDRGMYSTDTLHTLNQVRESFTREDFDGIDWSAVCESLLTE